ncbi:MAG: YraN family protein [Planctomycetia bacterium]|nr:YraN family protein [Planctomycetia bacterium]
MRGIWNKLFGDRGERAAVKYLKTLGFRIVAQQYSTPWGEIDIVAIDEQTVVFVEVKTRKSIVAGHPFEAVNQEKQSKLTRMALAYLKRYKLLEYSARFDVVSIIWPEESRTPEITHISNAFEPVGKWQFFS